jgi:hypothetical protein
MSLPPTRAEDLPAFVAGLHADLKAHLVIMRERRSGGLSSSAGVVGLPTVAVVPNAAA